MISKEEQERYRLDAANEIAKESTEVLEGELGKIYDRLDKLETIVGKLVAQISETDRKAATAYSMVMPIGSGVLDY